MPKKEKKASTPSKSLSESTRKLMKPYYVYMMKGVEKSKLPRRRSARITPATFPVTRRQSMSPPPASLSNRRQREYASKPKLYMHVGKSREPIRKVLRHNRSSIRLVTNRKLMTRVQGNWRLEEWFGPFSTRAKARTFQRQWTMSIRKKQSPPKVACGAKHYSARAVTKK